MDGSYINFFNYNGNWIFSSRGSFSSEQAILANKIFNEKYFNKVILNPEYNYIMELIGIDNRIVIYYPNNDLVLLTCFSKENKEINIYSEEFNGFNKVKKYDGIIDYKKIKALISDDTEGYVIRFKNGFRMKIKGDEYCRLHSIITNVSNIVIWKHMKDGLPFEELLDRVPDEFYNWVLKTKNELEDNYYAIECPLLKEFVEIYYFNGSYNRTKFAKAVLESKSKHKSILFSLFDNKKYNQVIWKAIRPTFSKPFRDGYDTD
jgi:RNA ligase